MSYQKLLLATNNRGKLREYKSLLRGIPYDIVTPAELGITTDVPETGGSFAENARLKAVSMAAASGLLTLADDSGLEVDALSGKPGPLSHRWAGEGVSDSERINYLLSELKDIPEGNRTGRFRCVIAVTEPDGIVEFFTGECRGSIATAPRGKRGFGYDPVFYVPELKKTFAELLPKEKNKISHRSAAAARAKAALMDMENQT